MTNTADFFYCVFSGISKFSMPILLWIVTKTILVYVSLPSLQQTISGYQPACCSKNLFFSVLCLLKYEVHWIVCATARMLCNVLGWTRRTHHADGSKQSGFVPKVINVPLYLPYAQAPVNGAFRESKAACSPWKITKRANEIFWLSSYWG